MSEESGLQSGNAHWFSEGDRQFQLKEFRDLCMKLSILLASNGEARGAAEVTVLVEGSTRLLSQGFDQRSLSALGMSYPRSPVYWLDPKALDYNSRHADWQDEALTLHQKAKDLSVDLRALATYE